MPALRARAGLLVAAVALTGGLSGCGVGTDATTLQVRKVVDGQEADAGALRLRNIHLEAPNGTEWVAGSDIALSMYVVNTGSESDALLSASAGELGAVALSPSPLPIPAGGLLRLGSAHTAGQPAPASGEAGAQVRLTGTTAGLRAGSTVRMQLVFQRAGVVTVNVPVATSD